MSLLTGLYAHNTGVINNSDRLDWKYRTLAHHFAEAGYLTGLIGKMHFGDAHKHGFNYHLSINDWLMYLGPKTQIYANEVASHPLKSSSIPYDEGSGFPEISNLWGKISPWIGHVKPLSFETMASHMSCEDHLDMFIARESAKFIKQYSDQPFLLVAGFMKPHNPLFPPKEYAELYPIDSIELPPVGPVETYPLHIQKRIKSTNRIDPILQRSFIAGYLGNISFVDECIGQILNALKEASLEKNTIVIYTSDHGEMLGNHGLFQKFCMFEEAVRVPLIVSYPKKIPRGKVTKALTEYIGLYPTLAELIGVDKLSLKNIPETQYMFNQLDAKSFIDTLKNPENEGSSSIFCEYNLKSPILAQYMIRTRNYKYIYNSGSTNELYDLEFDPEEYENKIDEHNFQETIKELNKKLFTWYNPDKNTYKSRAQI
jgi:choline-sulfatase